jgi:hypothetical protein
MRGRIIPFFGSNCEGDHHKGGYFIPPEDIPAMNATSRDLQEIILTAGGVGADGRVGDGRMRLKKDDESWEYIYKWVASRPSLVTSWIDR